MVTSKFADFMPLYRLEDHFALRGRDRRATMSVWCRDASLLVRPLHDRMVQRVLSSHLVCTDDTTMPMLAPGSGKTRTARMWVYVGDDANSYDVFDFTTSRKRDGPQRFLREFKGTLLADGCGGYDGVVVGNDLVRGLVVARTQEVRRRGEDVAGNRARGRSTRCLTRGSCSSCRSIR